MLINFILIFSSHLNFCRQVEVVVIFPARIHHAIQHAEHHVTKEAQILQEGRRTGHFQTLNDLQSESPFLHHQFIGYFLASLIVGIKTRDIFGKIHYTVLT